MQERGARTSRDSDFVPIKREYGAIVTKDIKVMQISQHCINGRLFVEFIVGIDFICGCRTKINVIRELDGDDTRRLVPTEVARYDLEDS